jgi:hypothetical protein
VAVVAAVALAVLGVLAIALLGDRRPGDQPAEPTELTVVGHELAETERALVAG